MKPPRHALIQSDDKDLFHRFKWQLRFFFIYFFSYLKYTEEHVNHNQKTKYHQEIVDEQKHHNPPQNPP